MKPNSDADLLLWIIEEAKYNYDNILKLVKINIEAYEQKIREVQAMSEEQLIAHASHFFFGVASKDYYIQQWNKRIETLKDLPERINHLFDMWKNDKWLFNETMKYYKGYVRQLKKAFDKLAENKFNASARYTRTSTGCRIF